MQQPVPITPEVLDTLDDDFNQHSFIQVHDMAYSDGKLVITPETTSEQVAFHMEPDAQAYLASFLGLPLNYMEKIDDPALRAMLWNYHIQKRGSDIDVLKAVGRGEFLKTFTTRTFHPLRPSEVVKACQMAIPDAVFERQPYAEGKKIGFHLTGPDLYEEFANTLGTMSDVHHFSVGVEFNFAGDESPTMGGYGHRHSCGNIMYSPYGVGGKQFRIYTTEPTDMLGKFTEYTRKGVEFIRGTMIPKIRSTMEANVPDQANEIADLARKYGLPERVESLVMEAYRTEDLGGTLYHVVNAITRAANSDRCPPQMISRLHRMAGEITVRHDPAAPIRRCNQCHQKLRPRGGANVNDQDLTPQLPPGSEPETGNEPGSVN